MNHVKDVIYEVYNHHAALFLTPNCADANAGTMLIGLQSTERRTPIAFDAPFRKIVHIQSSKQKKETDSSCTRPVSRAREA